VLAKANANRTAWPPRSGPRTSRARHRVAQKIEVGLCWVNSWFLRDLRTPFGGSKQSGIGREGGVHSLEFYTDLKNVCIKL
jgi:aminomuconate-semialdehyde/2-hydroxymuconate-6-semialdehyde dehydrogenase